MNIIFYSIGTVLALAVTFILPGCEGNGSDRPTYLEFFCGAGAIVAATFGTITTAKKYDFWD